MSSNSSNDEQEDTKVTDDDDKSEHGTSSHQDQDDDVKEQDDSDKTVEELTQQLETRLHVEEEDVPESIKKVAEWIRKSKRILVLSGAGVSCSAGIPDFRTPGTGLYDNLQKYNLPFPEAVFDLEFYRYNPRPFLSLARELWPGRVHSPTLTHSFLALLAKKGLLLRNYSQNIDGLEYLADIPPAQIMECHGHFRTASCVDCNQPFDGDECKRVILTTDDVPFCTVCGGHVKPDIVFFGEGLPERYSKLLPRDLQSADLLLIMGTSLQVAPVSLIPDLVRRDCKRVLFNRERVGNLRDSNRDVVHEGDCDDSVQLLAKLLNWHDELLELNQSTRIQPTEETSQTEDETGEATAGSSDE